MLPTLPAPDLLPVFNALPGANLLLSPDWVIVGASDDYLAATLTQRNTLVGQFIFDAFPDNPQAPEAQAVTNVRAALTQVLATKQPHTMAPQHYDVPDPARPGRFVERHWQPCHTPVLDAAGQVQFIIQSVQDITASRLAEQQLRDSRADEQVARAEAERQRQRFYDLLMQLPAQVAVHEGADHVFTLVNSGYQRLASGRELLGQPIREAWPELVSQGILDVLDQVYHTGEPFIGKELPFQVDFTRTGQVEQVYFNAFFLPLRDAQGQLRGVLDFSYDVTEQVAARQQLQQLNQELEARVQARTQELTGANAQLTRTNVDLDNFIYTASHDLRAPITNIEGLLLALREHLPTTGAQPDPLLTRLLDLMQGAVDRFQTTIAQLTDIARLQQAHDLPVEHVAVAEGVEAVRLDLLPQLRQAGAQLTVAVAPDLRVAFAPKNLRSVVYNLLSNALKYQHPDRAPVVELRADRREQTIVLTVQDNGLGLNAQQQGQLFGLFRRLHTHVEGTGVGLYMVKRMVENAGGTITVQSQPAVGTTFSIHLPA